MTCMIQDRRGSKPIDEEIPKPRMTVRPRPVTGERRPDGVRLLVESHLTDERNQRKKDTPSRNIAKQS